jgi:KaiC/GvpD/RAD55 family RecA-like ATPase
MNRFPFGIKRLDAIIDGGAPPGSVVLLAGDAGAGAREFLYTCAVINGLADTDPDQFRLNYGQVEEGSSVPNEIHFVSFTASEAEVHRELKQVIDPEVVEPSLDAITFADLSATYFQLSQVPHSWYAGESQQLQDLGQRDDRRNSLEALGDYLDQHARGNLVLIDSLSDLGALAGDRMTWSDIAMVLKGLRRAARNWDGLILLLLDKEGVPPADFGQLMGSADGTFVFEWAAGGNELDRTMVVKEFRGVLPEIEEEDIVRFETEIHEGGFDISDVRKIR